LYRYVVEKSGRIKLADFGMAKTLVEQMSATRSFKGSAFWMAPEVIRQKGHGGAVQVEFNLPLPSGGRSFLVTFFHA
jgi:serine/threonine protein kinase